MYWDWIDQLSGLLTSSHNFFWDLYQNSTFYIKSIWLGVMSLLTYSQVTSNVLLVIYLLFLFKKENWIKELVLICVGRIAGLFIGILITTMFGDYNFQILIGLVNYSIGPLIVIILLVHFWINKKGIDFKIKTWCSFIFGLMLSFYLDPVFYGFSRFLPFFFGRDVFSFIKPFLYSMILISPLTLFGFIAYGFEFDKWVKRNKYFFKVLQKVMYNFLILIAINSFIIYWF
ncbi:MULTISPECIES: hypothetical protein [Bacillaceae]|uniref:hypothetical protein n=1 Tax=Bacillaceae TaxID=186817 RepID=UPI000BFD7EAF|nr:MULTISPECIES: hypothetical protein [Bacillaceae]MCM3164083.1 hypothetical protein [Metabacillus litoralis]PGT84537.1 hypothetical protein COD11_10505 [Bacillus sp. AFS040349]UGB33516.1 hypothetical protein LPC09_26570 [Metabacillus sp. B2-18]